jgi:hypothetical protein
MVGLTGIGAGAGVAGMSGVPDMERVTGVPDDLVGDPAVTSVAR